MSKIVTGYWDCPYCNNKGISGLEKRCTACGHPQDEGTKFYLKEQKEYVSEDKAGKYGKGADWTCSYCGALNRHDAKVCVGCGADREESSGDYFENVEKQKQKAQAKQPEPTKGKRNYTPFIIGLVILLAIIGFSCRPKNYGASVTDKEWSRAIDIEKYETVSESDWSVPDGGRVTDEKSEIHHYDDVLDHYETVTVEKSRQVQDGYDTHVEYDDNGDGTFTEREVQTPRYKTEYYTEEEEQPVYEKVPRYQTKYYYDIDKWVPDRTLETSGGADTPYWDDTVLSENEREGERRAEYKVTFTTNKDKTFTAAVDEGLWNSLDINDNVDLMVKSGRVTSVNGTEIE
ncbi:MAG: hypothetical protein IKT17_08850 [Lachnospiraceae bacterium]|nr:hypothetical protein [Lachnospiraceae bacterium]